MFLIWNESRPILKTPSKTPDKFAASQADTGEVKIQGQSIPSRVRRFEFSYSIMKASTVYLF